MLPDKKLCLKKHIKLSKVNNISNEYEKIKEKLFKNKVDEITKNKDILKIVLEEEILNKYYYKEGVYNHKLKNDKVIREAVNLLKNQEKYKQILSAK